MGGESLDIALLAAGFAFLIYFLPRPHPSWLAAWIGAAVASILFAVGKWAVGLYLARSMVSSAYGAAGSLVVVMIWVYYTSQVLLVGAALTHAVDQARQDMRRPGTARGRPREDPPAPFH